MQVPGRSALVLASCVLGCHGGTQQARHAAPDRGTRGDEKPEAVSLLGEALYRPPLAAEKRRELEADLAQARREFELHPDDPERVIWLGRRLAYLGRYRESLEVYGRGIERWPDHAKLRRHRGHRYITVRDLDAAVADLERAAALIEGVPDEIEPDGAPNKSGIPVSTSHTNIWYHLGLAYYLQGKLDEARRCYAECLRLCTNDDMLCATSHWLYMTLRRLGRHEEAERLLAPIHGDMRILEDFAYHRLLLMYKGETAPESLLDPSTGDVDLASVGYGVGSWYSYNGRIDDARATFERIVRDAPWSAFGRIAAEADLARLRASSPRPGAGHRD